MNTVNIKGLSFFGKHGVLPEENSLGQKFVLDCSVTLKTEFADINDDIQKTVDYSKLCESITSFLSENTFSLLETAAYKTCCMILDSFAEAEGVVIEMKKPWAPVGQEIEYASVRSELKRHTAFISIGSNMGNKEQCIRAAIKILNKTEGCSVEQISPIIETKPYGDILQDDFLNCALRLSTYHSPQALLSILNTIEKKLHRVRTVRWGPRTIDLDIVFYDDIVLDTEDLHIPHIDMQNRSFVLIPLCSIAPYYRHPILNKTVEQLRKGML